MTHEDAELKYNDFLLFLDTLQKTSEVSPLLAASTQVLCRCCPEFSAAQPEQQELLDEDTV